MSLQSWRMCNLGTLRLPVLMWDHENKSNPAASMWVFHNNVRLACCEVYDGLLHQLRGANAEATQAVLQYCEGSDGNDEMDEDLELTQQEQRRRDSTELILALLLRSRQSLIQPIFSVCLSVMALRAGVGVSYWDLLRRLGLVLNKQFTQRFCRAVSERLREQRSEGIDVRVRFVVADNCSYSRKTTHQHVNRDGTRQDTVNWLEVPHGFPVGSIHRGLWHNGSNRFAALHRFDPRSTAFANLRLLSWQTFIAQAAAGLDILTHPAVHAAPPRTVTVYQEPVLNVNTASYQDIDTSTQFISDRKLAGSEMILIVGDQQLYIRLLWQKIYNPDRWTWMLPLPGEWHFSVHVLMALHKLWFRPLVEKLIIGLSFSKTIKDTWTSVEVYVYYDRFYQLLISACADYLRHVVPQQYQQDPRLLLEAVSRNHAAVYLFSFLYDFGFPWLRLRHAIRANDFEVIDVMWPLTFHWFHATGKTNYTCMAVYVTCIRYGMKPELASLWTAMRTASLCGHRGRNVPFDLVLEKMNREAKQLSHSSCKMLAARVDGQFYLHTLSLMHSFAHSGILATTPRMR